MIGGFWGHYVYGWLNTSPTTPISGLCTRPGRGVIGIVMTRWLTWYTHRSHRSWRVVLKKYWTVVNSHAPRHWKSNDPINRHAYKGICNRCWVIFIKGAPRSASKLGIDPINSHASYFGKSTRSNKRNVPINRTVSSNWHQRVHSSCCKIMLFKIIKCEWATKWFITKL